MSNQEIKVIVDEKTNELVVRTGQANNIFQYKGFDYTAHSTDSLIELVESKGSAANSVIAYTETGIKVILDDTVTDRPQSRITYDYKRSQQFKEFERILTGTVLSQKEFVDFLKRREPGEINDLDKLLGIIQQFRFAINITGDAGYIDSNNRTFAIKIGDAEGTVSLPQTIIANLELFNESGMIQAIEIELEVDKPKSETERLTFSLSCPKLNRYLNEAVKFEIDRVKEKLPSHLIVAGNI